MAPYATVGPAASVAARALTSSMRVVGGHHARGEPQGERLVGPDGAGLVEELDRLGGADQSLEGERGPGVAGEGNAGEGEVVAGGVGQDPQVAGEREGGARAGRHAVDGCDHRLGHARKRGDDGVVVLVHGAEQLVGVPGVEDLDVLLEVLTHAERAPAAGQDDAARRRVVGDRADRVEQRLLRRDVEAVHRVGTVQGDRRDAVGEVEQDGIGHGPHPAPRAFSGSHGSGGVRHASHGIGDNGRATAGRNLLGAPALRSNTPGRGAGWRQ